MERSLAQGHPAEARGGGDRSPPTGLSFRHYHFVLWGLHLPRMPGRKRLTRRNWRPVSGRIGPSLGEEREPRLPGADVGVGQGGQKGAHRFALGRPRKKWIQWGQQEQSVGRFEVFVDCFFYSLVHSINGPPCAVQCWDSRNLAMGPAQGSCWSGIWGRREHICRAMTQDRCANGLRPGAWKEAALPT